MIDNRDPRTPATPRDTWGPAHSLPPLPHPLTQKGKRMTGGHTASMLTG